MYQLGYWEAKGLMIDVLVKIVFKSMGTIEVTNRGQSILRSAKVKNHYLCG
jgi:hypothetical protein